MNELPPLGVMLELEKVFRDRKIFYNENFMDGDRVNCVSRILEYRENVTVEPGFHEIINPTTFKPETIFGIMVRRFVVRLKESDLFVKVGFWHSVTIIEPYFR